MPHHIEIDAYWLGQGITQRGRDQGRGEVTGAVESEGAGSEERKSITV